MKRNGTLRSSCKSGGGDTCALDFLLQAASPSSVADTHSTIAARAIHMRRKLIDEDSFEVILLFSYDQHFELPIFRRGEEKTMSFRIERHSLGPRGGLHRFDYRIHVRAVLMNNSDGAFAIGVENQLRLRIKSRGIDVISDRQRGDHLARVGVQHGHNLTPASDE